MRSSTSLKNANNTSSSQLTTITNHQKQAIVLLVLSAIIYAACKFDVTLNMMVDPAGIGTGRHEYDRAEGPKPGTEIKMIALLGERNSGTRWTSSHLDECFSHAIEVRTKLTRYKHWFQYPASYRYPHETLVITQFRNPYDWLKAMQHVPHHAPDHLQFRPDDQWMEFLTSTWTMERVGTDKINNTRRCQQHFEYKDVISCETEPLPRSSYKKLDYSRHQPFYEMRNDGSGKPYDNIMELRTDKIRNFLSIKNYDGIADVWAVQYEYLLTKGTQELLDEITRWTGIEPNCTARPPQQRRNRPVEREMADFVREHLNWTVEAWIGYGPHML
mmetsp:Transcript_2100/g.4256  ORF Transcript_2100/g.4256 Transcript_2100/m.4256 type:complete len:330 (-) Transcript_2100:1265-2254(-)